MFLQTGNRDEKQLDISEDSAACRNIQKNGKSKCRSSEYGKINVQKQDWVSSTVQNEDTSSEDET